MREIKFRAWEPYTEKEINESEFDNLGYMLTESELLVHKREISIGFYDDMVQMIDPTRLIWMQFIGLKDKNGKEIYEGDIVKWGHLNSLSAENPHRIAIVKIDPDIQFHNNDGHIFHLARFMYAKTTERDLEIIGNIYSNPELLPEGFTL